MPRIEIVVSAAVVLAIAIIALLERQRAAAQRQERLNWLMRRTRKNESSLAVDMYAFVRKQMARPESLGAVICGVVVLLAAGFLGLSILPTFLLLLVLCPGAWWSVRSLRLRKLRRQFADRFPDAVENLTRSVQAGVPMEKALAAVGENYEGELGRRFRLLVQQLELGVPFRRAMETFSESLDMPDVDFFCAVLALNRESGSRLTPMLISLSRTLRERRAVARKLRVMTSETRSAAKVLSFLPCLVLAMQFFLNPQHFKFLFNDPTGRMILGCCAGLMVVGIFIINRMSNLGGPE